MQESSKKSVLRVVSQSDGVEEAENGEDVSIFSKGNQTIALLTIGVPFLRAHAGSRADR